MAPGHAAPAGGDALLTQTLALTLTLTLTPTPTRTLTRCKPLEDAVLTKWQSKRVVLLCC